MAASVISPLASMLSQRIRVDHGRFLPALRHIGIVDHGGDGTEPPSRLALDHVVLIEQHPLQMAVIVGIQAFHLLRPQFLRQDFSEVQAGVFAFNGVARRESQSHQADDTDQAQERGQQR